MAGLQRSGGVTTEKSICTTRAWYLAYLQDNARETDFQAACGGAKIAPGSHFYDYRGSKPCYAHP
ncbi:hypothetical protein HR51_05760 [Burkholderia cepacia]|nr:hypothetical protein HR51_05760 [Burkholderia cepacia]